MQKEKWKPIDYIVMTLVLLIVITLGASMTANFIHRLPMEDNRAEMVEGIYISVLAIISIYVGSKLKK